MYINRKTDIQDTNMLMPFVILVHTFVIEGCINKIFFPGACWRFLNSVRSRFGLLSGSFLSQVLFMSPPQFLVRGKERSHYVLL